MSGRSREAQLLARLLSAAAGVRVRVIWSDQNWSVAWTDGPTCDTMRDLAARLCREHSVRCPLRWFHRGHTDLACAASLLGWLARQGLDDARRLDPVEVVLAYDAAEQPQAADEDTLRRGRALLSLSGGTFLALTMTVVRQRLATTDVPGVLEWLDGIAAAAAHLGVADLEQARQRRAARQPAGAGR